MRWLRFVGSMKTSVILLAVLFLVVFGGTLGQAAWGASAVQTTLFQQVFFQASGLWWPGLPFWLAVTGVNLAAGAWVHLERSVRHLGLWLLHATLVLFCFSSLGFSLLQDDLVLGLPVGAQADRAFVKTGTGDESRPLPFTLKVDAFRIETYPNSAEPSDYVSSVTVTRSEGGAYQAEVRMNQPLRVADWAVYQSSVQAVEGAPAPVFKLMHNPWAPFPYVFSVLLGVSLLVHAAVGRRKGVRP